MSEVTKKRLRETSETYVLAHLVDVYGDTSEFHCIAHKIEGDDDPITGKGLHRSTPSSRRAAGVDFYDDSTGDLLPSWTHVDEEQLLAFTQDHHCALVIAYLDE